MTTYRGCRHHEVESLIRQAMGDHMHALETDVPARPFEGLGRDASDLVRIVMWADEDPQKLARLYCRYPRSLRITVPMVERFLQEELGEWKAERGEAA